MEEFALRPIFAATPLACPMLNEFCAELRMVEYALLSFAPFMSTGTLFVESAGSGDLDGCFAGCF